MDITFNTKNVDASVALKALKHYRAREYQPALVCLLEILDFEPNNWDARLMLAVCYYKTNQMAAAQRAFRHIWQNCKVDDIRATACDGLQAATAALKKDEPVPLEFGACVERKYKAPQWLD